MKGIRIAGIVLSVVAFLAPMVWAEFGAWSLGTGLHGSVCPEMASALNLTEDQKQILQELQDAYSNEFASLKNQLFSKNAELRILWEEPGKDREKLSAMHEEISTLRQQLNQLTMQYQMDCLDVLTPDQQAALTKTTAERHGVHGKHHP